MDRNVYFQTLWPQINWTQLALQMHAPGNTHLSECRLGSCVTNKYLELNVNINLETSNLKEFPFLQNPRKVFDIQKTISETLNI
jgi:hypothetical protein